MTKIIHRFYFFIISCTLSINCFASSPKLPSEVIDLSHWKLTLPLKNHSKKSALEIEQPSLSLYSKENVFFVNQKNDGVIFRAHCKSISTKNSKYPRCELREMKRDNHHYQKAAWGTSDGGIHTMSLTQAITALPSVKDHVVSAQIHHEKDDLLMIRLEGKKLFIERNNLDSLSLDSNYKLGQVFHLKIEASGGFIQVYYNHNLKMNWKIPHQQKCYFKAGCYTQSNPSKGDKEESYGEVVIYDLKVEHHFSKK